MKIKNEKKAMQMFSADTHFRKQLTRPFIDSVYDGKVIATDGYVLLIVDKKLLRCKYETDSLKINRQQSCKSISIPISFAAIDDAHNQLELVPEEISEDGKDKDCPECLGEGQVEFEYNAGNGQTYYHYCNCPICDGTGIREDYVPVKTGRMLVPEGSVFIMRKTYFDACRVWKVVEALRLMGFEQITWVGESETGMNWFEVCDGMQLVLRPMANTGNFKQEIRIEMEMI